MPVVVQAGFGVEILALKPQRLVEYLMRIAVQSGQAAVGGVLGGPDDFAAVVGQFLGGAEVVELVVIRAGFARAFAVEHRQWPEGAGLVDVAAVVLGAAFGDEVVALPEEFGGVALDGLADPATKGIVSIGGLRAVGQGDANQSMLAVVAVLGHQCRRSTPALADQVPEGVVGVLAIALLEQAVAFDGDRPRTIEHQQVACRVVNEAFRLVLAGVVDADQAVKKVVLIAALAVSGVSNAVEVAVGAVGIISAVKRA